MNAAVTIRTPKESNRPAILAVLCAAFEQEDEAHLVDKLWMAHGITHEFIAEMDGVIIGYCAFSPITCAPELDGVLLGLAPAAVAPDHQRRGVGSAMIEDGLKACRKDGARLIAVLGDPKYYARFGFEPAAKSNMRWAVQDAGDAFRVIIDKNNPMDDIKTNEPRLIHYHPAFDAFS